MSRNLGSESESFMCGFGKNHGIRVEGRLSPESHFSTSSLAVLFSFLFFLHSVIEHGIRRAYFC